MNFVEVVYIYNWLNFQEYKFISLSWSVSDTLSLLEEKKLKQCLVPQWALAQGEQSSAECEHSEGGTVKSRPVASIYGRQGKAPTEIC